MPALDAATYEFDAAPHPVMAHPHLLEPHQFMRGGKPEGVPKFEAQFVFDLDQGDLIAMKQMVARIAREHGVTDFSTIDVPFKDGTALADKRAADRTANGKEADGEYQRGKSILTARTQFAPTLGAVVDGRIVDIDTPALRAAHGSKFYFGTQVLGEVKFEWHDPVGRNPAGVHAYLNAVISLNDGERISGSKPASARFKGYIGRTTDRDPRAGGDPDGINF